MAFKVYDGHVHGLGTIRVDGKCYGTEDLLLVGREMFFHSKTTYHICAPIRVYSRGPGDLRLEYDFKVQAWDPENQARRLHGQVHNIVLSMLKIKGRWNHNHWLGIELVAKE